MILKNKISYSNEDKELLWEAYERDRSDRKIFNQLLEAYLPLLEVIASKTKSKLPAQIEIGDLLNDGFFGLVDAIEKYDASKGWKFETYASNRIRGEINDRLRDYDWVSRYSRLKFKQVAQTEEFLTSELQREPSIGDIARRLDWPEEEVNKVKSAYSNSFAINIDEHITDSTHEVFSLSEIIPDSQLGEVDFTLDMDNLGSVLESQLFSLPEHESIVVFLLVYENQSFEEIADVLDAKTSKIIRIYESAIDRLRESFGVL